LEESNKTIANIPLNVPEGMSVESKLVKIEQIPRYYKLGNGVKNTFMKNHTPIDAITEMSNMSPQELWTLKKIRDNLKLIEDKIHEQVKYRTSCKAVVINSEMTNAEKQKFKTGYKRLHEKNILKRIKRQHYMLNPDFLVPYYYKQEKEEFDKLN